MDLQLDKRYPLQASPEQAWALLADVRATAACMPGAVITEQLDATQYRGQVRAKIGPAQLAFDGEIELIGLDAATHSLHLRAKGADKAGSAASMELQAQIEPAEGGSVLVGKATVRVSGKLAQIGNRLLLPASEALLAQFAAHFNTAALAQQPPVASKPLNALQLLWATLRAWWSKR